jgi:hypothetical protein
MIVKPYAARRLLVEALKDLDLDVHLSEAAVFALARGLEEYGRRAARRSLEAFLKENDHRRRLCIPRLRRLTDAAVEEALDSHATDA